MKSKNSALSELIEPAVTALGYELLGCVFLSSGRRSTLRVYIDSPNGVNIDDCQKASRQISVVLDVEDPITQNYDLEVSSPGLDRPLFKNEHFQKFIGYKVKLRLYSPVEGRRNLSGILQAVTNSSIAVTIDNKEFTVRFDDIDQANLVPDLSK